MEGQSSHKIVYYPCSSYASTQELDMFTVVNVNREISLLYILYITIELCKFVLTLDSNMAIKM